MGKVRKRQKKFNYDKNRKKAWKKSKKLPSIQCKQMKNAWDEKKSITQNLSDMGISADPNRSVPIPKAKDFILTNKGVGKMVINEGGSKKKSRKTKLNVIKELEAEASTPQPHTLKFSEPEVRFCIYMMEKYGEDYKKMARDERNYYQETPKQIRRKILTFKNIPEQYNAYLKSKKQEMDTT